MIPRGNVKALEETMEEVNNWYRGWYNYYRMTSYPSQLRAIEAHIRRRIRARIVAQQKRPKFLLRKLVKLGVDKKLASRTAYSRKGPWAISHMRGVEFAFSNSWFRSVGQLIFSGENLPHWFDVRLWIKLTEEPCT